MKKRLATQNGNMMDNELENKEAYDKQHLSDVEMDKLRNVIKTKVAGEVMIKLSDIDRILHLAGQNMTKDTVEKIRKTLEDTYQTDEYFLDEIEPILAPYWEELSEDDIAQILIESFQAFEQDQQGFIDKEYLAKNLTTLGDMPMNTKDLQIMFSLIKNSKKFDYQQFVKKLCELKSKKQSKKKKKKKKKKRL